MDAKKSGTNKQHTIPNLHVTKTLLLDTFRMTENIYVSGESSTQTSSLHPPPAQK